MARSTYSPWWRSGKYELGEAHGAIALLAPARGACIQRCCMEEAATIVVWGIILITVMAWLAS